MVYVAIPSDDAYWRFAAVTACSVAKGCSLPVAVHLIDGGVTDAHWDEFCAAVEKVKPGTVCLRHRFEADPALPLWHGSRITWSRLFLHQMLPDVDWVISADADVLFSGNVAALWDLRDDRYLIMPSKDRPLPWMKWNEVAINWHQTNGCAIEKPEDYFCVGLCMLNLKGLREEKGFDPIGFLKEHPDVPFVDQTVLNCLLQGRQKILPNEWGAFSGDDNRTIDTAHPFALHFVSDAPWKRTKVTQLISEPVLWWHRFAAETLGWKFKVPGWWWRRTLYVFLKKNPWVVGWNSRLRFHFRNAVEWL